jgi:hypothetical protein
MIVLTSYCAVSLSTASSAARRIAVALTLTTAVISASAHADDIQDSSCVGGWHGFNCVSREGQAVNPYVRLVPAPLSQAEQAQAVAADRKWLARCRPVKYYDPYGVVRYRYAASGCEFGVGSE